MRLFVDDIRDAPDDSWHVCRKVEEAIRIIARTRVEEVSLDHDIENRPSDETYKPVAYFLGMAVKAQHAEAMTDCMEETLGYEDLHEYQWLPKVTIHSMNPAGAKEMADILSDYGIVASIKPYGQK
jgi:hypothetical protein